MDRPGEAVNEDTLVKTMELPYGQDWAWFADANVVVLSPHLCDVQRDRALREVQEHWRRSCLRILPIDHPVTQPTLPLTTLVPRAG
jgi:hypothetical protein